MGWGAEVLVAVRGPVREVDLFRHQFRRFWEAFDDDSCKRAWMRVHTKQHTPSSPPPAHEWWWLEQAVYPADKGVAQAPVVNSPESLVVLAARQCATQRSLASDLLLLPEELRSTVLALGTPTQLAQLLRYLADDHHAADSDGAGEAEAHHQGDADGDDRAALLKVVGRVVAEGLEGELLYQACLRKETLEYHIAQLAPSFPRLTIFLLAAPECWADQAFDRIYTGSETFDPGSAVAENRAWHHDTWHIDDARDLRGGEWRSFSFDVLAYDHEFEWGLDAPCPCAECHDARRLDLGGPTPPNKNVDQVWSSKQTV